MEHRLEEPPKNKTSAAKLKEKNNVAPHAAQTNRVDSTKKTELDTLKKKKMDTKAQPIINAFQDIESKLQQQYGINIKFNFIATEKVDAAIKAFQYNTNMSVFMASCNSPLKFCFYAKWK